MTVTFGTRSAMRELAEELEQGEEVVELAGCTYAGAAGLLVLTNARVLAIRDDFSKHQVQHARLPEVVWIDYAPTTHDGFAVFTATGRLVVRKMRRADGDRLVDALLDGAPHVEVRPTCPLPRAANAEPVATPRPRLGRHHKPGVGLADPVAAVGAQSEAVRTVEAPAASATSATEASETSDSQARAEAAAQAVNPAAKPVPRVGRPALATVGGNATGPIPIVPEAAPAPKEPTPGAQQAPAAPAAPPEAPVAPRQATDKEILLGVLADLHAQGVLSAEDFAAKVRQIVTPD